MLSFFELAFERSESSTSSSPLFDVGQNIAVSSLQIPGRSKQLFFSLPDLFQLVDVTLFRLSSHYSIDPHPTWFSLPDCHATDGNEDPVYHHEDILLERYSFPLAD